MGRVIPSKERREPFFGFAIPASQKSPALPSLARRSRLCSSPLGARFGIPAFVVTLAGFNAFRGLALVLSDSRGLMCSTLTWRTSGEAAPRADRNFRASRLRPKVASQIGTR